MIDVYGVVFGVIVVHSVISKDRYGVRESIVQRGRTAPCKTSKDNEKTIDTLMHLMRISRKTNCTQLSQVL